MYARFSLSNVSILYGATIWFSVTLAVLSIAKTAVSMRVATESILSRDAWRTVKFFATVRKREFWINLVNAVGVTPIPGAPKALPRSGLRVLRPTELFILTPLRLVLSVAIYMIVRDFTGIVTLGPDWFGTLNSWFWFATFVVYLVYVVSRAAVAVASTEGSAFEDACRIRDLVRRLRH
jgi:hypothetical protein